MPRAAGTWLSTHLSMLCTQAGESGKSGTVCPSNKSGYMQCGVKAATCSEVQGA